MKRWVWITTLSLAGCLSTPPPGSAGDGGPDPCVLVREPPPAQVCDTVASLTAMPFPGGEFSLRNQLVRDVNGDGVDDLVLASDAPNRRGVFVLLGPQSDPAALVYHAFVPTTIPPSGLAVENVTGPAGGCPEIIVVGRNDAGNAGYVMSYEYVGGDNLFASAPVAAEIGFVPPAGNSYPVMVTTAAIGSSVARDLVVADLFDLSILATGGDVGANLETASATKITRAGGDGLWGSINALVPVPSAGSCAERDDLVIVQNDVAVRLRNDGVVVNEYGDTPLAGVNVRGVGRADLDGNPPDDLIGGAAGPDFGGYLLDYGIGDELLMFGLKLDRTLPPLGTSFAFDGLAVADLGGATTPELVVADAPDGLDPAPDSAVWLVDGLHLGETLIEGSTPQGLEFSDGFLPRQLLVADFDDDGDREVWVFAVGGEARCVERQPSPPDLRLCQ